MPRAPPASLPSTNSPPPRVPQAEEEEDEEEDEEEADDDEEEEGELAPAELSDEGPEDYDSADDYDDDLFKGAQDRTELLGKSDLEREMILADRHERKQRRMETLQVRRRAAPRRSPHRSTAALTLPGSFSRHLRKLRSSYQ